MQENQNSKDSAGGSTGVERLAAVPVMPRPRPTVLEFPTTPPIPETRPEPAPSPPQIIIQKPGIDDAVLAAFTALGFAVSARFLVFLGLLGAFVLSVMAMRWHDVMSLAVLGLYCLLAVLPLVVLELRSKRKE
jgi:hypothetical protein